MNKWISLFGVTLSLFTSTCQAGESSFLLFGDSYFDTGAGNAVAASLGFPPNEYPNPNPPYPNLTGASSPFEGRHSNGPIWIDYSSAELGIPYTDYGVSGATTGTQNFFNNALGGLFQQVARFEATQGKVPKDALVVFDGGGNDFFFLLENPDFFNPATAPALIASTVTQAVNNMGTVAVGLSNLGAKKIVMWNLGNMGKLPIFTDPTLGLTALAPVYTAISAAYDQGLQTLAQTLNQVYFSGEQQLFIFDANTVFNEVEAILTAEGVNLTQHQITNPPYPNFIVNYPTAGDLAFYDQVHPTTRTWKIISKYWDAYDETLKNGPRFTAAEQDLVFETSHLHRDVVDNHFRTLITERYVYGNCCDECCCSCPMPQRFQFYIDGAGRWGSTRSRAGAQGIDYSSGLVMVGATIAGTAIQYSVRHSHTRTAPHVFGMTSTVAFRHYKQKSILQK